jgi:hypothetical protein
MQHAVVDFATSLLSIKAQIICNHFTDDTLIKISGAMQLLDSDKKHIPAAIALLRDEASKNFRIEVTSDSMIYQDEQQEKADRTAFLAAIGQFTQMAMPAAQQAPELVPMLMEMLKFGVTAFKAGKQLEGIIDETADKFREQAKMAEGQPKQIPIEIQKIQMEQQAEMQKLQMQQQLEQAKMSAQMELEKAKQEYQAQENQLKFQLENERNMAEIQMNAQLEEMKQKSETSRKLLLAYVDNSSKIETARISAGLDDGAMAYENNVEMATILEDTIGAFDMKNHPLTPVVDSLRQSNQDLLVALNALHQKMNEPKIVIRDANGKIAGVTSQSNQLENSNGNY